MTSNSGGPLVLRSGELQDADDAAALHASQIREGFLTFLGQRFLRRLYRRVVQVPESFLLVVVQDTSTVGFLAGSTDVAALYRAFAWHDSLPAVLDCAWRLVRSWRRVVETLRHGTGGAGDGAELLAVAVDPAAQGRGVGTLLVEGFIEAIGQRGQDSAHVVVAAGNETAVALYRRAGFHPVDRFELHSGTESLLLQWTLHPTAST